MSTYELRIDSSSAEAGAERIVKSFESIKAAAARMEGGVVASANKMVAAYSQLSRVKSVSREAVDNLNALSSALSKFRGPSGAAVRNTTDFLAALSKYSGLRLPSVGGLAAFLNATARYTGPTPQAGKNLQSLLKALSGFNGISGLGSRVNSFMTALAGFRGPTANAGKNVQSLFKALGSFTGLPRGFASSAQAFIAFAAAVDRTTEAFRRLRAVSDQRINAPAAPRGGTGGASGSVRGLAKDYGFLETAILRTQTAMNSLGGILAARSIINASNDILKIRAQLYAATGSIAQAEVQFGYLQQTARSLGLELTSLGHSYGLFLGSIKGSNFSIAEAQRIFSGFATAGRAMQLSTQDIDGIFRALGQIISKGKLQAEELRGQLGDRLPGAFTRMAAALGMSVKELDAAMKKGLISGDKLKQGLMTMAESLQTEFADAAKKASLTVDAAFNRLKNAFTLAAAGMGNSGLNDGLIKIADGLTKILESKGLGVFLSMIGNLFKFVGDQANFFASVLGGFAVASTAKWLLGLKEGVSILQKLDAAQAAVAAKATQIGAAFTAGRDRVAPTYFPTTAVVSTGATPGLGTGMDSSSAASQRAAAALRAQAAAARESAAATGGAGAAARAAAAEFAVLEGTLSTTVAVTDASAVSFGIAATSIAQEAGALLGLGQAASVAVTGVTGFAAAADIAAVSTATLGAATVELAAADVVAAESMGLVTTTLAAQEGVAAAGAATMSTVATATAAFTVVETEAAAAAGAATVGIGAQTAATGALSAVMAVGTGVVEAFALALKSIPFILVIGLLTTAVMWFMSLKTKADEAREAMDSLSAAGTAGSQVLSSLVAYIDSSSRSLSVNTQQLRENTAEQIRNNIAKSINIDYGATYGTAQKGKFFPESVHMEGGIAGRGGRITGTTATSSGGYIMVDGVRLPASDYRLIQPLIQVRGGKVVPRSSFPTSQSFAEGRTAQARLQWASANGGLSPEGAAFANKLLPDSNNIMTGLSTAARINPAGAPYRADLIDQSFIDMGGAGKGTPDLPGGSSKGKKKRGGSAGGLSADEQDLRRAMETVRDLNREIGVADASIKALSGPDASLIADAARGAAQAQLNNIEDAFSSPEKARAGTMKFAASLKADAIKTLDAVKQAQEIIDKAAADPASVAADQLKAAQEVMAQYTPQQIAAMEQLKGANIDTYEGSKKAALDYLSALQQLKAEKQKELEVTKQLADIRIDIATKTADVIPGTGGARGVDMVSATAEGGRVLADATLMQQAMAEAVGVSTENYDAYVQKLFKAKKAQQDLNAQLEIAAQLHKNELERAQLMDQSNLMLGGMNERDMGDTMHMLNYQRDLIDKGIYSNEQINGLVAAEKQMVDLRRASDDLKDSYTKLQQVSQDVADTIVGGFRDAVEGGKSFLDSIKGIFRDLKRTLLDFVLYNPLKQFLQNWMMSVLSPQFLQGTQLNAANGQVLSTSQTGGGMLGVLTSVTQFLGGVSPGAGVPSYSGTSPSVVTGGSSGQTTQTNSGTSPGVSGSTDVVVTAQPQRITPLQMSTSFAQQDLFYPLRRMFQWQDKVITAPDGSKQTMKGNLSLLKDGFKDISAVFNGGVKGVGKSIGSLVSGLGKVAGVALQAYTVYDTVKGIGQSLGLGDTISGTLGGAAAGFAVGGPIGAGIGAVIGFLGGVFSKSPRARADLIVGSDGKTSAGNIYSKSGGNRQGVTDAATGAGTIFGQIADQLNSYLTPGNYGTFGEAKKIKGDIKTFYSATGRVDGKGRPTGRAGVDFMIGTPDQITAFALKTQIKSGKFGDLDPVYKTIAERTSATGMDALSADLNVGKSYLDFIDQGKVQSQLETQTQELTKAYESLRRKSAALGLDVAKLDSTMWKLKKRMKDDFNFDVNQGILGIRDPIMAEWNQLLKDYENSVRDANAVGGDLAKVEEYYGLQRAEIIKKYMEQANNGIKSAAADLYRQLTATDASPLAAQTIFNNAQSSYMALRQEIMGGNYANVDKLGQYSQDYLSAAQNLFSSSTDFFNVFNTVTDFLQYLQNAPGSMGTGTDPSTLPGLPTIAQIQQQIIDTNNAVVNSNGEIVTSTGQTTAATQAVGAAVTETNSLLEQIRAAIAANGGQITFSLLPQLASLRTMNAV